MVINEAEYLSLLAEAINRELRNPGRRMHNLVDSRFDAWTSYYQQDEIGPKAIVSY